MPESDRVRHTHEFVEHYQGMMAMGLDRKTDEDTLICTLQKFSDDQLIGPLVQRLTDVEIEQLFNHLTGLMRIHLSEEEYHRLFLKDVGPLE